MRPLEAATVVLTVNPQGTVQTPEGLGGVPQGGLGITATCQGEEQGCQLTHGSGPRLIVEMKITVAHLALLYLLTASACASGPPDEDLSESGSDILRGRDPGPPPLSFFNPEALGFVEVIVPIGGGSGEHCSGLLLNKRWVLTAQHCFPAGLADTTAITVKGLSTTDAQTAVVTSSVTHVASMRTFAPYSAGDLDSGRDVVLVQLETLWPNAVPQENGFLLEGGVVPPSTLACGAYGGSDTLAIPFGDFRTGTFAANDPQHVATFNGSTFRIFGLDSGSPANDAFVNGDSGGPCFVVDAGGTTRTGAVISKLPTARDSGSVSSPVARLVAEEAFAFDQFDPVGTNLSIGTGGPWDDIVVWGEVTNAVIVGGVTRHLVDYIHLAASTIVVKPRTTDGSAGEQITIDIRIAA